MLCNNNECCRSKRGKYRLVNRRMRPNQTPKKMQDISSRDRNANEGLSCRTSKESKKRIWRSAARISPPDWDVFIRRRVVAMKDPVRGGVPIVV